MPLVSLSTGIRMYYEATGSGEHLILVPGSGGAHGVWSNQIGPFSEFYRCIALDLRGGI